MKTKILMLAVSMAFTLAGCSGENAKDLFETAQLEELQNNPEHAATLYRQIVENHPETEYAERAKGRLDGLKQARK